MGYYGDLGSRSTSSGDQSDYRANLTQKNGLCSRSAATVLNGPCPGQIRVSPGKTKI